MIESAHDGAVYRRVEGLVENVRTLAFEDEPEGSGFGAEWLEIAATGEESDWTPEGFTSLASAWQDLASRHGLGLDELEGRVAASFGLEVAEVLEPSRAALRLVPEAMIRGKDILPLREDAERITVATADPTSLEIETELIQLTGRTPVFVVASPTRLREAIAALFDRTPSEIEQGTPESTPPTRRPLEAHDGVLVVDDDPPARILARQLLEKGGYTVVEAEDGEQALHVLGTDPGVALIVADLNMPRLDGLELIWEVRERPEWAGIPVIVVTGETDEILEAKLIEEGADDYIRKPLDPRLFLARVAATIRRAEH
jgi:CheY-like chemotaxis protein